uniref:Uncharacterized protein n=1 Tax=Trichinella nativa TaxID=6335 RepID=A0A0V1KHJ8_9BILA
MLTVGPGVWHKTLKNVGNEKCTLTWNMARKLKNLKNEKGTL